MLKSYGVGWGGNGVVGWGGGPLDFSVSPRSLGFGFLGFWVLGLRVWGQGLTIIMKLLLIKSFQ